MPKRSYTRKNRKMSLHRKNSKKSFKNRGGAKTKGKKWTTAIAAAESTLKKTKSLSKAQEVLRSQALVNAQRLFGQVNETK